jgi:Sec-independent protein translocase protein TatA
VADQDSDKDLVRRITEDHYFQHLTQQQARAAAEASIDSRMKTWKWLAALVVAVFAFFGFQLSRTFSDVRESLANAKQQADEARTLLAELKKIEQAAKDSQQGAAEASQSARKSIAEASSAATQIRTEAREDRTTTIRMAELVGDGLRAQSQSVAETAKALNKTATEQEELLKAARVQGKDISKLIAQAQGLQQTLKAARDLNDQLATAQKNLKEERKIFEEIARAQNWGLVMIRARSWAQLDLPDPSGHSRYRMWFYSSGIKPPLNLDVAIEQAGGSAAASPGGLHPGDSAKTEPLKGLVQGRCVPLPKTPFFLRVDFVYHSKLSSDFVALRVLSSREACESQSGAPGQ